MNKIKLLLMRRFMWHGWLVILWYNVCLCQWVGSYDFAFEIHIVVRGIFWFVTYPTSYYHGLIDTFPMFLNNETFNASVWLMRKQLLHMCLLCPPLKRGIFIEVLLTHITIISIPCKIRLTHLKNNTIFHNKGIIKVIPFLSWGLIT